MKKILAISSVMIGVLFLAGCGQQLVSQTKSTTQTQPVATQSANDTANLQTYTSDNLGISFQYPKGWYVREVKSDNTIYVENTQKDVNKDNLPADFQRIFISTSPNYVSAQKETNIKNGNPDNKEIVGSVSASTMSSNGIMINTYEYQSSGGPTLQAFWTDKSGKKYYASHSTEAGDANQKNMIENLKKILATVKFTKVITWCDDEKPADNKLWISSEFFNGTNHAPTIRHLCRGNKELFSLEMTWDDTAGVHTGKLISKNSGVILSITSKNKDPEVKLIDEQNKKHSDQVWFTVDGKTFMYDENTNQFIENPKV